MSVFSSSTSSEGDTSVLQTDFNFNHNPHSEKYVLHTIRMKCDVHQHLLIGSAEPEPHHRRPVLVSAHILTRGESQTEPSGSPQASVEPSTPPSFSLWSQGTQSGLGTAEWGWDLQDTYHRWCRSRGQRIMKDIHHLQMT